MSDDKIYIAIDLKSFYASVECVERGLDPLTTNLVVADPTRTEKTICLAVSPSLKAYGISGRARLFEALQRVEEVNRQRQAAIGGKDFTGESTYDPDVRSNPNLKLGFIMAPPQMARYVEVSTKIYSIYLKYIAPEDIHVYSIDEVFIDATGYLKTYKMTAHELTRKMIDDVLKTTGITATAGIGTNLYLCKVAMDIVAKHIPPDKDGVRIAQIDEMSYRELLWTHRPITDFWRVGRGTASKLAECGIYTMGDIARCSLGGPDDYHNEDLLFRLCGVGAELLIDHAWGVEPCLMEDIKAYRPMTSSLSSGQVLKEPYDHHKAAIIVREMTDALVLDLVAKGLVTDQMVLTIGYDVENLNRPDIMLRYKGPVSYDHYGRRVPSHAHGSVNLGCLTSSTSIIVSRVMELYEKIAHRDLLIRRINIAAGRVYPEEYAGMSAPGHGEQMDMFTDYEAREKEQAEESERLAKEKALNKTMIDIKNRFGGNSILKASSLKEGSTAAERNRQIGGHQA
ncbi:MAG: DNA methylase [Clostridiales bacterium]|nr:DNA methylase [Clostridiales bacterium]